MSITLYRRHGLSFLLLRLLLLFLSVSFYGGNNCKSVLIFSGLEYLQSSPLISITEYICSAFQYGRRTLQCCVSSSAGTILLIDRFSITHSFDKEQGFSLRCCQPEYIVLNCCSGKERVVKRRNSCCCC